VCLFYNKFWHFSLSLSVYKKVCECLLCPSKMHSGLFMTTNFLFFIFNFFDKKQQASVIQRTEMQMQTKVWYVLLKHENKKNSLTWLLAKGLNRYYVTECASMALQSQWGARKLALVTSHKKLLIKTLRKEGKKSRTQSPSLETHYSLPFPPLHG